MHHIIIRLHAGLCHGTQTAAQLGLESPHLRTGSLDGASGICSLYALGLVGAIWLSRFLSSLVFGVAATDPATFVAVSVLLTAVAAAACYVPARRAARVNPLDALKYQ